MLQHTWKNSVYASYPSIIVLSSIIHKGAIFHFPSGSGVVLKEDRKYTCRGETKTIFWTIINFFKENRTENEPINRQ